MKALILKEPGKLVMDESPVQEPEDNELLIETKAATICTSDINDIRHNTFDIRLPMIMGHEGAGRVVAVGKNVKDFKPGDRIAAHPVMACGKCRSCLCGLPHLCDDMVHLGINKEGVFAQYFRIRADRARIIPEDMDYAAASLMEPVCVCIEAIERANVVKGSNVLVMGDGPFGIMIARLLKAYEPARIILTGRHWFRIKMAEDVIPIHEREVFDTVSAIEQATGGEGIDSAILCVGSEAAVNVAVKCLRARGTLSVFSAVPVMGSIDLFKVHVKELTISGSCNDEDYLDEALELLGKRDLGLSEMITHKIAFTHWEEAFRLAEVGKDEALKVTMVFE